MRTAHLRIALVALALASCSPPESPNPLSDPATAKADKRLDGIFVGRLGDTDGMVRLVPKEGARFDLVLVVDDSPKGAVVLTYDAFPTALAGKTYLNLRRKTFTDTYAEKFELSPDYIFARYEFDKSGALTLWTMDSSPVSAAVKEGKLKGKEGDPVKLTASTEELAAFVSAAKPDELWHPFGTFKKVKGLPATRR